MSKLALVRALLAGGIKNPESDSSIHRFQGFKLFSKSILIWKGFEFKIEISDTESSCNSSRNIQETSLKLFQEIQETLNLLDISHATYQVCFHSKDNQNEFVEYINSSGSISTTIISKSQLESIYIVNVSVTNTSLQFIPLFRECSYFKINITLSASLSIPSNVSSVNSVQSTSAEISLPQLTIYTRENNELAKVDIKGLTSHKLYGIDNTGNVCVWASESILLYTLLHSPNLDNILRGKSVLELGGGMTALCGLSLAALSLARSVVLTDGHPDCVRNQRFCIQLNQYMNSHRPNNMTHNMTHNNSSGSSSSNGGSSIETDTDTDIDMRSDKHFSTEISSEQLRWSVGDTYGEINKCSHNGTHQFDLIIGSDILFFTDFHDGLIEALHTCLTPTGTVLLLQPVRGGTMERFVSKARECGKFHVTVSENYNEQVRIT